MSASSREISSGRPRLLLAIASFGGKNLHFLRRIIQVYRHMAFDVDIVVHSNTAKDLGERVEVVVGLPARNPWTLPFAHKQLFAENLDRYDLFVYSEDDIGVSEANIRAFIRATKHLQPLEIAGYLRYEEDASGQVFLPDVHHSFHWKPESVKQRGDYTIAEFTNEHAGFYILTQSQLRNALASGNYLRPPYEGRYGLPETAATDPYTCCGFKKVICISALDDFLLHHLPNRYVGQLGMPLTLVKDQVQTLIDIADGTHPVSTLSEVETKLARGKWSKNYYEEVCEPLLDMVPSKAQTILSIGSGWGGFEMKLKGRGASVTTLPLDSLIGKEMSRHDIHVIYGTLEECLAKLNGTHFDCVLLTNILHLVSHVPPILDRCASLVANGGALLVQGINFEFMPGRLKYVIGWADYRKLASFEHSGVNPFGVGYFKAQIVRAGLELRSIRWLDGAGRAHDSFIHKILGRFVARTWILHAERRRREGGWSQTAYRLSPIAKEFPLPVSAPINGRT